MVRHGVVGEEGTAGARPEPAEDDVWIRFVATAVAAAEIVARGHVTSEPCRAWAGGGKRRGSRSLTALSGHKKTGPIPDPPIENPRPGSSPISPAPSHPGLPHPSCYHGRVTARARTGNQRDGQVTASDRVASTPHLLCRNYESGKPNTLRVVKLTPAQSSSRSWDRTAASARTVYGSA